VHIASRKVHVIACLGHASELGLQFLVLLLEQTDQLALRVHDRRQLTGRCALRLCLIDQLLDQLPQRLHVILQSRYCAGIAGWAA
jgi:hypothetical protein